MRRDKNYYIYYYNTSSSKWTKYDGTVNAAEDIKTVIDTHLSNRVEIQLEKDNTAGTYIQFNHDTSKTVTVETPDTDITGYNGYKHTIATGLKIEKISHKGSTVRGIGNLDDGTTIDNVTKFWVFYQSTDTGRNKPLILCYSSGNKWYHRGKKWIKIDDWNSITIPTANLTDIASNTADKAKVTSKLDAIFYRQNNSP